VNKKYSQKTKSALDLWVKLARAFSVFNKKTSEQVKGFGLTYPQFAALECVGHLGPMTIGELSKKMLVSGGNMTVVIDNLEREGLLERIRDNTDRRVVLIQLTKKGRTRFNRIFPQHAGYIVDLASVLTRDEQTELSRLLKKLGLALAVER
jgi:MarR family transcriptional regulator, 2-MHQ and catechol-resistance regulon repressor